MPRRAQGTRTASPSNNRHRRAAVPGGPTVTTYSTFPKGRDSQERTAAAIQTGTNSKTRQPFRRRTLRVTSPKLERPATALQRHPLSRHAGKLLLRPHSHSAAFESRGRPSRAPGTIPAATELPGLAIVVFPSVTSLARQRQADLRRTPSLPARRSFPQPLVSQIGTADFSGPNAEAAAYPST